MTQSAVFGAACLKRFDMNKFLETFFSLPKILHNEMTREKMIKNAN